MRLTKFLWTHSGPPPPEYLEYVLCREVYHCLPSQLRAEPLENVLPHLIAMSVESRVRTMSGQGAKE